MTLPKTLDEALIALEQDEILTGSLGKEFIDWFITEKRSIEVNKLGHHDVRQQIEAEFEAERAEYLEFF